ncbi:MAG TPA: outer membrane lipoprotein carrier protein LolA, partial [Rhodocyclaceae bacterium]|nr:outer membrane lipoprotein carrier protein LolA [Rhodocyclaceae bacterium]
MRLFILALWAVSLAAVSLGAQASGLDQLKSFLAEVKTARGSFVQTVVAKSGRKPQQSQGF